MAGFSLTGDIFNMFVWFELMGVCAYALAGFKIKELGPVQGAFNFAITNTFAAYMILTGIALLYARTGILNLAQIGHELAGEKADRLVIVALTLLLIGLMVKAAIVPFHFWLADAHAAAPAPVCVLFSGAMVELGIYFIARVYWTVFDAPFHGHAGPIKVLLVVIGMTTTLVGALMCFLQRHLKRLLAYSTISHAGAMLAAVGLLDPKSLAGVANLILAHAFLKGGLFLVCGLVLIELRHIDEIRLHGAGRGTPVTGALWFLASFGLVGIPYTGIFLGHGLIDDGAIEHGYGWVAPLTMLAAGACAGAMLRAGARVFLGWGAATDELLSPEPDENPQERDANVPLMWAVTAVMIGLGLLASLVPGLQSRSERASERFVERAAYANRVLHGVPVHAGASLPFDLPSATAASLAYGLGALLVALLVAAAGLWHGRLHVGARTAVARVAGAPVELVRRAHSGIAGDYLLWIAAGTAVVGAIWAVTLP
jgi:multicomponent Na+:H+ antiporter subunit D